MELCHSDIEIGIDIAKCFITILKLILVLQNPLREYWNWYWYREMHWGSIEIDIDIAKCFEELLKLLLILQNPLPNIDVFSISKNSVSHIPDLIQDYHPELPPILPKKVLLINPFLNSRALLGTLRLRPLKNIFANIIISFFQMETDNSRFCVRLWDN